MKKITVLTSALLVLAACKDEIKPSEPSLVRLDPIITRSLSLNFNNGNEIGVRVVMDEDKSVYADNSKMTYDGSTFSGDLKWYTDGSLKSTVIAWYPYSEAGFPSKFSVAEDQSKGTDASDFMVAVESGVYPSSSAVLAKFRHQFAQINVVVKSDFDVTVDAVSILRVRPTADITLSDDGSVSVAVDGSADLVNIVAEEVTANKLYSAVLVPQDLSDFGISVSVKNGSTILSGISNASLKAGYSYTVTAVVTADSVTATISGEILSWEDGGSLDAGDYEVSFEEFDGYFKYDGVTYPTVEINGRTWMAAPLAYLPLGTAAVTGDQTGSVYYPYKVESGAAVALTDAASIKANGYLYTPAAAYGVEPTLDNYTTIEGIQGICPNGWHIPTWDEVFSLCGQSVTYPLGGKEGAQTDETAYLWDESIKYASVEKYNAAGYNFNFSGMYYNGAYSKIVISSSNSTVEDYYGNPAVNYTLTSSPLSIYYDKEGEYQYFNIGVQMTTFTKSAYPLGRVTVAQLAHTKGAASVRCIKNEK